MEKLTSSKHDETGNIILLKKDMYKRKKMYVVVRATNEPS